MRAMLYMVFSRYSDLINIQNLITKLSDMTLAGCAWIWAAWLSSLAAVAEIAQ